MNGSCSSKLHSTSVVRVMLLSLWWTVRVILLVILLALLIVTTMVFFVRPLCANTANNNNKNNRNILHLRRGGRKLHEQRAHFNVQLFLDLQFVDESLALDFESLDETNPNILHFCKAVQTQVGRNKGQKSCRKNPAMVSLSHHTVFFIHIYILCS